MTKTATTPIPVPRATRVLRETGLAARTFNVVALSVDGSPAIQLHQAGNVVEFDASEVREAIRTLNSHRVAEERQGISLRGDVAFSISRSDRDALHAVLQAAVADVGLNH
jgi:hypothetical protein